MLSEHPVNDNNSVERMLVALKQRGIIRYCSNFKRSVAKGILLHKKKKSSDGLTKVDKKLEYSYNAIKQDFVTTESNKT